MENKNIDIKAFFKENILSSKTVIILLSCMICILLIYISSDRIITDVTNFRYSSEATTQVNIVSEKEKVNSPSSENILKVNINSDNIFELCQLPGIGQSKAQLILQYRKQNGDFHFIEELMNVKGIGETIYNNLKDYIYIEAAE